MNKNWSDCICCLNTDPFDYVRYVTLVWTWLSSGFFPRGQCDDFQPTLPSNTSYISKQRHKQHCLFDNGSTKKTKNITLTNKNNQKQTSFFPTAPCCAFPKALHHISQAHSCQLGIAAHVAQANRVGELVEPQAETETRLAVETGRCGRGTKWGSWRASLVHVTHQKA